MPTLPARSFNRKSSANVMFAIVPFTPSSPFMHCSIVNNSGTTLRHAARWKPSASISNKTAARTLSGRPNSCRPADSCRSWDSSSSVSSSGKDISDSISYVPSSVKLSSSSYIVAFQSEKLKKLSAGGGTVVVVGYGAVVYSANPWVCVTELKETEPLNHTQVCVSSYQLKPRQAIATGDPGTWNDVA